MSNLLAQLVAKNSCKLFEESIQKQEKLLNEYGLSMHDYIFETEGIPNDVKEMLNNNFSYKACEFFDNNPDKLMELLNKIIESPLPIEIIGSTVSRAFNENKFTYEGQTISYSIPK